MLECELRGCTIWFVSNDERRDITQSHLVDAEGGYLLSDKG